MILEELKIEDTTTCYVCGSSVLNEGDSLHAWSISYTCGCKYYKRKENLENLLNKEI